jgi:hypothetical protein
MDGAMFEQTIIDNLLTIVAAYRKATGRSLASVSKDFYGRGDFFSKLTQGTQTIGVDRLSAMLDDLRKRWPEDAAWPMTRPVFMTRTPPKK